MDMNVISLAGKNSEVLQLSDEVFGVPFKEPLIHQVVTAYLAAGRSGTHAQKTRAAVRGGGAKPWRQKGTGRARAGSIRSPLWRGGGKTFAAVTTDYSQKINKKMYRGAIRSILSELIRQSRLIIIDSIVLSSPKTKDLNNYLKTLDLKDVLIISDSFNSNLFLSSRNIKHVDVVEVKDIDPVSLIRFEKVLFTTNALQQLQERLV